ncbi:MAG: hypothetical protein WB341_06525 [Terracidiphilus sp.]
MKKIAIVAAVFVLILLLTKIANQMPPEPPNGSAFWINAQHVIECTPTEITLVESRQAETHFDKDPSWPDCSTFHKDDVRDFHLVRREKTRLLSEEKTAWRRKEMLKAGTKGTRNQGNEETGNEGLRARDMGIQGPRGGPYASMARQVVWDLGRDPRGWGFSTKAKRQSCRPGGVENPLNFL